MNVSIVDEPKDEARDDMDILSDNVLQRKQLTLKDIQEKFKAPYVQQVSTELELKCVLIPYIAISRLASFKGFLIESSKFVSQYFLCGV